MTLAALRNDGRQGFSARVSDLSSARNWTMRLSSSPGDMKVVRTAHQTRASPCGITSLGSKPVDDPLLPVGLQKSPRAGHPEVAGNASHHVLDEDEQIVRMALIGRHGRVMHHFEIDEPRAPAGFVVNEIAHVRITVRPKAAEIRAIPGMRPAQFVRGRGQHGRRDRPAVQMACQVHPRDFVRGHPPVAHGESGGNPSPGAGKENNPPPQRCRAASGCARACTGLPARRKKLFAQATRGVAPQRRHFIHTGRPSRISREIVLILIRSTKAPAPERILLTSLPYRMRTPVWSQLSVAGRQYPVEKPDSPGPAASEGFTPRC